MPNNNQALIDALRQAADFLEAKPDFPAMGYQNLCLWADSKEDLRFAARQLGSFTKVFTDSWFELHHEITPKIFSIEVRIWRDRICKKVVTWDCPDEESLLRLVSDEDVEKSTSDAERCEEVGRGE